MSSTAHHAVVGNPDGNFWLHHTDHGFDLTHPATPTSSKTFPRVDISTQSTSVTIDPAKSALVIIDMQNYFLSAAVGRPQDSKGLMASKKLLDYAIPAAREAGIQVIWLNWGLTEQEIRDMPPATMRAFGFEAVSVDTPLAHFNTSKPWSADLLTGDGVLEGCRKYKGPGCELGQVQIDEGIFTDGGRLLMRDQWNSALIPELEQERKRSLGGKAKKPDVSLNKNRMSGLCGHESECTKFLDERGIRTLFFAGVNTDQCVGGSLQDAFTKGYDCLLLSDGCGTTSPSHAQECIEYNSLGTWGFVLTCEQLVEGVKNIQHS